MLVKRPAAAVAIAAFFILAILGAQSIRTVARAETWIKARAAARNYASAGLRKALKRAVVVEDGAASSDGARGWRFLTSRRQRVEAPAQSFHAVSPAAPRQKVSTNLFLSVLNL